MPRRTGCPNKPGRLMTRIENAISRRFPQEEINRLVAQLPEKEALKLGLRVKRLRPNNWWSRYRLVVVGLPRKCWHKSKGIVFRDAPPSEDAPVGGAVYSTNEEAAILPHPDGKMCRLPRPGDTPREAAYMVKRYRQAQEALVEQQAPPPVYKNPWDDPSLSPEYARKLKADAAWKPVLDAQIRADNDEQRRKTLSRSGGGGGLPFGPGCGYGVWNA